MKSANQTRSFSEFSTLVHLARIMKKAEKILDPGNWQSTGKDEILTETIRKHYQTLKSGALSIGTVGVQEEEDSENIS